MTNPQRRQIDNRRSETARWRSRKPWKNLVEDHAHIPTAVCVHCLKKHGEVRLDKNGLPKKNKRGEIIYVNLTINHISRTSYFTEELYCTWNETDMEICCTLCNWKIEIGLKPCPVCHYAYIHWREYSCQACWDKDHPIEAQIRMADRNRKVAEAKALKVRLREEEKARIKKWKEEHNVKTKKW